MAANNQPQTVEEIDARIAEIEAARAERRRESAAPQQPPPPRLGYDGRPVTIEDIDRRIREIEAERARKAAGRSRPQMGWLEDAGRSLVTGVQQGVTGLATLPRTINDFSAETAERFNVFGDNAPLRHTLFGTPSRPGRPSVSWPTTEEVDRVVQSVTGPYHEPQTTAGEFARTIGQFGTAAVFPGSAATRAARVAVPGAASEGAGQATRGTPLEVPARIAAGLGAGVAVEAGAAANAARAARQASRPQSAALEQEFGPLTRGERSGNPRARQEEDDLRRGIGSDRAQRMMQAFDDRRTPTIRDSAMRIPARGQGPLSEDLDAAGTTVSDALRTRLDNMRQEQANLYTQALRLARTERVAANEVASELLDAVDARIADEFLDAGAARSIVGRLQAEIAGGRATYETVERARQALNRQLGTAMKSGDDAQTYAVHAVIDEVDKFVAPRLSPEASRAVTEARGFTREMLGFYGQRQRTDLATGHVGRSDPGGRAIERVLNQDMTGEQVIDAILGGATKPSQQTLGAVRRIREIHDSLKYTNRNAASGVRVPGRKKVGGQTEGERRFAADSEASRYGIEVPKDELQGLREGLFHRILRPLENRNDGGMIPAQTIVTNLRRTLDGPSKEITQILFTPGEIAAMRRLQAYLERIVPPSGTAVSGTHPAFYRSIAGAFDKLVGIIPGLGPVIREAIAEANTTGAARRAVAPQQPQTPRKPPQPYRASATAGPLAVPSALRERNRRR